VSADPIWLTADQQRAWRAYLYANNRLMETLDRELQVAYGIGHPYYEIFVNLSEAPGRSMRMSDLAAATRSSRSRLSHAVARLEEKGWVERRGFTGDRRGQVAVLTDAGFALLEKAARVHVEGVRRYLIDPLSAEQIAQLERISRIIYQAIPGDARLPLPE
jgi:DNA-binding MarR family transcriptional regulator